MGFLSQNSGPRGGAEDGPARKETELQGGYTGAEEAGAGAGSFWDSPNVKYSVQLSDHRPELVG